MPLTTLLKEAPSAVSKAEGPATRLLNELTAPPPPVTEGIRPADRLKEELWEGEESCLQNQQIDDRVRFRRIARELEHRHSGIEISGISKVARGNRVSGDEILLVPIDDSRFAALLLDAPGHGISAARIGRILLDIIGETYFPATGCDGVKRTYRDFSDHCGKEPAGQVLAYLDARLDAALSNAPNSVDYCVAAGLAVFNSKERWVECANGGIPALKVIKTSDPACEVLAVNAPGQPLGSGCGYRTVRLELAPGDIVFLSSDGIFPDKPERNFPAGVLQAVHKDPNLVLPREKRTEPLSAGKVARHAFAIAEDPLAQDDCTVVAVCIN